MKIFPETLKVLQNFATINTNIVFNIDNDEGGSSVIRTRSEANNIMGVATLSEKLPRVGIYDLPEFLSAVFMFDDPEFEFDSSMNFVTISEGRQSVKYYFSDPEILTFPTKTVKMPKTEVSLFLFDEDLLAIRKAASTFSVSDVIFYSNSGDPKVHAKVTDMADATSNSYDVEVSDSKQEDTDAEFSFSCDISNLKLMRGHYDVGISSKLVSHFRSTTLPVEYFIAMEKKSYYKG